MDTVSRGFVSNFLLTDIVGSGHTAGDFLCTLSTAMLIYICLGNKSHRTFSDKALLYFIMSIKIDTILRRNINLSVPYYLFNSRNFSSFGKLITEMYFNSIDQETFVTGHFAREVIRKGTCIFYDQGWIECYFKLFMYRMNCDISHGACIWFYMLSICMQLFTFVKRINTITITIQSHYGYSCT